MAANPSLPTLRGLYAVTPELDDTAELVMRVAAALAGGARWVQYRNKAASPARRHEQALALLSPCRAAGAALVINDDVELALGVGADGVHLGIDDGDPAAARAALGQGRVLGVSCYADLARARLAKAAGADYVAFGAMFASPTKPQAVRTPLSLLAAARAEFGLPVAAIGGITLANAATVIAAGGDLLAVISDLFEAPDIETRARDYQRLFAQGTAP